jgi:LTXXQ motif family protein
MLKTVAAGATALFLAAPPLALAQTPSPGERDRLSAADMSALTDARITIIKTALQLTPDQEKLWPPIETAIRDRAKDRQARLAFAEQRVGERREQRSQGNVVEAIRDRNPIDFMHRRAEALDQRGADMKKLADAWQPLYQTLTPDQKRRMGALAIYVVRELRNGAEERRLEAANGED